MYIVNCDKMSQNTSVFDEVQTPITIKTSGVGVSFKEFFILAVFLALFLYSVISFLKTWNTTCRAISHSHNYQSPDLTNQTQQQEEKEKEELQVDLPGLYLKIFDCQSGRRTVSLRATTLIFFQTRKILQQRRSRWWLG